MAGLPALLAEALPGGATAFMLTLARAGGFVVALPGIGEEPVPVRIRLLLAAALGTAMLAGGRVAPAGGEALTMLLSETVLGLALGLLVRLMLAAAAAFGAIAALQIGLSAATIFDPAAATQNTVLARFAAMAAATVLLAGELHLRLIAGFARSYAVFPPGTLPTAEFARAAVDGAAEMMRASVELAGPLLVYGLVFNLALGLFSRAAPQIQTFFIAQPLNLIGGLALLAATIGATLAAYGARVEASVAALFG